MGRGQAAHRRRSLPMSAASSSSLVRQHPVAHLEHRADPASVELGLPAHPCCRRCAAAPRRCCSSRLNLLRPPSAAHGVLEAAARTANSVWSVWICGASSVRLESPLTARSGQQGAPARAGGSTACGGQCFAAAAGRERIALSATSEVASAAAILRGFSAVASALPVEAESNAVRLARCEGGQAGPAGVFRCAVGRRARARPAPQATRIVTLLSAQASAAA